MKKGLLILLFIVISICIYADTKKCTLCGDNFYSNNYNSYCSSCKDKSQKIIQTIVTPGQKVSKVSKPRVKVKGNAKAIVGGGLITAGSVVFFKDPVLGVFLIIIGLVVMYFWYKAAEKDAVKIKNKVEEGRKPTDWELRPFEERVTLNVCYGAVILTLIFLAIGGIVWLWVEIRWIIFYLFFGILTLLFLNLKYKSNRKLIWLLGIFILSFIPTAIEVAKESGFWQGMGLGTLVGVLAVSIVFLVIVYFSDDSQNKNQTVIDFIKSKDLTEAKKQFNLGNSLFNEKNYIEAVKYFSNSAEQGYSQAQYRLGVCYFDGVGIKQSHVEAAEWWSKAAKQGHVDAQYNLGECYFDGIGVKQNHTKAAEWWSKAAEQGHANAQNNLGVCCEQGLGVKTSYTEAVVWYRKAAEQGHAVAQYNLGGCYFNGTGLKQNDVKAVEWYQKAAEQGYTDGNKILRKVQKKMRMEK